MKTPQEMGREWEEAWRERVSGTLQPGSGNKFYARLDVKSKLLTWSNKWTGKDTFTINEAIWQEARDATMAPGGNGSIPALAIRMENLGDFVMIDADDFLFLLTEQPIIPADKAAIRRATAKIPELLRDSD